MLDVSGLNGRLPRGYGRADDGNFVVGGDDLEGAALERAHLHHVVERAGEHGNIDESRVRTREEETPGTIEVDAGRGRRRECAVPQAREGGTPHVAGRRAREYLIGFHVEKAHPHAAVADDAL